MPFDDRRDLYFTSEGDFVISETSDLEETKNHQYRNLIQQILTRLMSSKGDWALQPTLGASLGNYLGQPNTRETGDKIKTRILSELSRGGLLAPSSLKVEIAPVTATGIIILITATPPGSRGSVFISFTYDMSENKLIPRNV